jgi:hypothetical protein
MRCLQACGALDPKTFEYYERLGLPMLLLFLSEDGAEPQSPVLGARFSFET